MLFTRNALKATCYSSLTHNALWIVIKEQFLCHNALDVVARLLLLLPGDCCSLLLLLLLLVLFQNTKWLLELLNTALELMSSKRHDWMLWEKKCIVKKKRYMCELKTSKTFRRKTLKPCRLDNQSSHG